MSNLSPDAREIIAGRHADSFCYLGPHTENNEPVLRVFLPDARRVVVSVRGELELPRIDDAGLFARPFDDPPLPPARAIPTINADRHRHHNHRRGGAYRDATARACCPTLD